MSVFWLGVFGLFEVESNQSGTPTPWASSAAALSYHGLFGLPNRPHQWYVTTRGFLLPNPRIPWATSPKPENPALHPETLDGEGALPYAIVLVYRISPADLGRQIGLQRDS